MLLQKSKIFLCFGIWNLSISGQLTFLTSNMALFIRKMQKLPER